MDWKEVVDKIGSISLTAGTVLGNPLIVGGGGALKFIAKAFGLKKDDPSPEEVMAAIQADPQAAMKLEMARIDFEKEQMRLEYEEKDKARDDEIERFRLALADVQDARKMGDKNINLYILSWLMISGFFGLLITLMFISVPEDSSGVIFMLFGALSTAFGAVIQYFFGSSKGSADKSMELSTLLKKSNGG